MSVLEGDFLAMGTALAINGGGSADAKKEKKKVYGFYFSLGDAVVLAQCNKPEHAGIAPSQPLD
jgi:hypothetical protein